MIIQLALVLHALVHFEQAPGEGGDQVCIVGVGEGISTLNQMVGDGSLSK